MQRLNNTDTERSEYPPLPAKVRQRLFWIWGVAAWISLLCPLAYSVPAIAIAGFFHLGIVEEVRDQRSRQSHSEFS